MSTEITIYQTTDVTDVNRSTMSQLLERTELMCVKSADLGDYLVGATEVPNGYTCTVDAGQLACTLDEYLKDFVDDEGVTSAITDVLPQVVQSIDDPKSTVSINVCW